MSRKVRKLDYCPVCQRLITLTDDRRFLPHGPMAEPCVMSGKSKP